MNIHAVHIPREINDLDGAVTLCKHGVGLGVFPKHCIEAELKKGLLKEVSFKNKANFLPIYIAHKNLNSKPLRIQKVLDAFWSMKMT